MKILLEEFNLIRYAIEFDPDTLEQHRIERTALPDDAFEWGNSDSPIKGCFADVGNERVYLYGVPSDIPNIFGRHIKRIFQTSDGCRVEIGTNLRAEFESRVDLPHKDDERWIEFRLVDGFTKQIRYKTVYDVMPILKMYWQDFTPYIEYKDWDFCAYLKDIVDQNNEAASRVEQGLPPNPHIHEKEAETLVKPALPFGDRLRGLPGEKIPLTGYWWSPAFQGEERVRHFRQGERFPSIDATSYGSVIWYFDPAKQGE